MNLKSKIFLASLILSLTLSTLPIIHETSGFGTLRVGIWIGGNMQERTGAYWVESALGFSYATSYQNTPIAFITLGIPSSDQKTCMLKFSKPYPSAPDYDNVQWSDWDYAQTRMSALQQAGIEIVVDFGPQLALSEDVIEAIFLKYPPSTWTMIVGINVDWEWVKEADKIAKIPDWIAKMKTYLPNGRLYLCSWIKTSFGSTFYDDAGYMYDGQGFSGATPEVKKAQMLSYFTTWRTWFDGHVSGNVWGYDQDKSWTQTFCTTQADLKDFQDDLIEVNPNGLLLMYSEQLLDQLKPILPTEPLYEYEPPPEPPPEGERPEPPEWPPAPPEEPEIPESPPPPEQPLEIPEPVPMIDGEGTILFFSGTDNTLYFQHRDFDIIFEVMTGTWNSSNIHATVNPNDGRIRFTANEDVTLSITSTVESIKILKGNRGISGNQVIATGETVEFWWRYLPMMLPIPLFLGLGGLAGMFISSTGGAYALKDKNFRRFMFPWVVGFIISCALFVGWLNG